MSIINIDTLILIQPLLKNGEITLTELLISYHVYSSSGTEGFASCSDYIINYLDEKLGEWRTPELLDQIFEESKNFTK